MILRVDSPSADSIRVSYRKTAKFTDLGNGSLVEDAPLKPLESYRATGFDDPKTSEYAFFKKLKEGTSRRLHSHPSQSENLPTKKFKSSDFLRERTNTVEKSFETFRSPRPVDIAHANDVSFSSLLDNSSQKTESQEKHPEIFFSKRQKLRQWVAESSGPEIDELCSKGLDRYSLDTSPLVSHFSLFIPFIIDLIQNFLRYDFVSVLLSRLFPETNVDTSLTYSKSMQLETDTNYKLPSSPNTDVRFEKCYRLPERNLLGQEYGLFLDDYSSSRLNVSTKTYLSKFDSSTFLSNYYHLQNKIREPDYEFGERSPILYTHCDSDVGFPLKRDGYHFLKHLNQLDGYQYPNESVLETEPHALLLGWDFESRINERNLSITSENEELSLYPNSSTSWSNVHQNIMDNGCGANGLCMSSFFPFYPLELTPLLPPPLELPTPSASYGNYYSREHFLKGVEDIMAVSNNSSLPLLPIESHQNPDDDCNYNKVWKCSSAFLSPQNQRFMHKVLEEGHDYPGTEDIISSGLHFNLGQKCSREPYSSTCYAIEYPQSDVISSHFVTTRDKFESYLGSSSHRGRGSFNHLSDDLVNISEWLPFQLQWSRDIDKSCPFPLLLDRAWWSDSEGETFYDDNEANSFDTTSLAF
ncbi:hypothetical protein HS088_TW17G00135 [Tripterygium wilfordii]|uniref:Uncharacterized protein n=1 Tax=Tripterygium wilfordii TaxID=458696 RepID=A0A7J7CF84_TRIWF|nr:hypothetical protein HS088_TW17G00135 [Tripterygium wilfordii]